MLSFMCGTDLGFNEPWLVLLTDCADGSKKATVHKMPHDFIRVQHFVEHKILPSGISLIL